MLTVKEVRARLNVGTSTVYDMIRAGKLRAVRLGKTKGVRVFPESVDAFLEGALVRPAPRVTLPLVTPKRATVRNPIRLRIGPPPGRS